jgi:hypothetical protein
MTKAFLSEARPDLAAQWHPTNNGSLRPDNIPAGSVQRVWWKCARGPDHEWVVGVDKRTRLRTGCPFCAGKKVAKAVSLASLFPSVSRLWHPTLNGKLSPADVTPKSQLKVWWICAYNPEHSWQSRVTTVVNGSKCPVCSLRVPTPVYSLRAVHPDLAAEWHPTLNGSLNPDEVTPGSNKKVWWRCKVNPDHEWQTTVWNRAHGKGCPVCLNRIVLPSNSFPANFPELAAQWHPQLNGGLKPDYLAPKSNKIVWWRCPADPAHEWKASINNRTSRQTGCPICSGRVAGPSTSLLALYPEIAAQWHPSKNTLLTPQKVRPAGNQKVWWLCPGDPTHEWEAVIYSRVSLQTGCPYCAGKKAAPSSCLGKLFPELADEWHPAKNGLLTPQEVTPGSEKKVWWLCRDDSAHEWEAAVWTRVMGSGCPVCSGRLATPTTSLKALYPTIAGEWHPTKNGELTPDDIRPGCGWKVWWQCSFDPEHEWFAYPYARTGPKKSGCPYCSRGWTNTSPRKNPNYKPAYYIGQLEE